jgi:hypothetical protein
MEKFISFIAEMSHRWFLSFVILVIAVVFSGVIITRAQVQATPKQPIPYSHRIHVEAGVQCLFCHSSALRSTMAGIPSVEKCMGCHAVITTESEAIQAVTTIWEQGKLIPWNRVNHQPDFVFFSHQPHMSAGLNCETCHGNVSQMDVVRPVFRMDMGWCLDCHLKQPAEKVARLADCLTCHK